MITLIKSFDLCMIIIFTVSKKNVLKLIFILKAAFCHNYARETNYSILKLLCFNKN